MMAAHNALTTQGLAQIGAVSNATLGEGQSVRTNIDMQVGCYTVIAFGGDGVRDIDLSLANGQGQTLAQEHAHDAQAGVRFCAPSAGRYQVTARVALGHGTLSMSTWHGGAESGTGHGQPHGNNAVAGGPGSCSEPLPIELGQTVNGDTSQGSARLRGSCATGESPELVYRLHVPRRMQVTVTSEQQDFDGAVYILRACSSGGLPSRGPSRGQRGGGGNEIACNDDDQTARRSRVVTVLDPGDYFVVMDGFDGAGPFSLAAVGQDVPSADELCQQAPVVTPGQAIQGDTSREVDVFHATCANQTPGPERVFRLDLQTESRVQATLETPTYDGALYIRRACAQDNSEIVCNDDADSTRQARVNTILPPGPYYIYSDAYQATGGAFTLQVDTAPAAGGTVAGDTCADAEALTITGAAGSVQGNLLNAHDNVNVSCGGGADTADLVYRLNVTQRGRLKLSFSAMDEALREAGGLTVHVTRNCGQAPAAGTTARPGTAEACRALSVGDDNPLEQAVEPGTYFVVVEAARARAFGRFTLNAAIEDRAPIEQACRAARALTPGRTITATTAGNDLFHASCAGNARSPEHLYRLTLRRRSHVRLTVTSTGQGYDPAIYLRSTCDDQSTERACVDDTNGTTNSVIEDDFDAGTYTVFVDGYSSGNAGAYTLETVVGAAGSGTTSTPPTVQPPVRGGGVPRPRIRP